VSKTVFIICKHHVATLDGLELEFLVGVEFSCMTTVLFIAIQARLIDVAGRMHGKPAHRNDALVVIPPPGYPGTTRRMLIRLDDSS
jgi:hypothetical protein